MERWAEIGNGLLINLFHHQICHHDQYRRPHFCVKCLLVVLSSEGEEGSIQAEVQKRGNALDTEISPLAQGVIHGQATEGSTNYQICGDVGNK